MSVTCIKNALVYDGSGAEPYNGDVVFCEDGILSAGGAWDKPCDEVIDARGRVVCPGFIDMHRHLDVRPFCDSWTGETELRQGITSTVAGQCGISLTPSSDRWIKEQYAFDEPVLGRIPAGLPKTYPDYVSALEKRRLPVNMAATVGLGSIRISLKGFSDAPFTDDEICTAQDILDESLRLGAPGASVGIMYLPECYTTKDEYVRLLRPLAEHDGLLSAHIRGEGDSLVRSIDEIIEIAGRAGVRLEISHFKSCGTANWRREIYKAIDLIEAARARGQDVKCDFYPYDGGSTALTTMLPPAYVHGDMASALRRLGTKAGAEEFERAARMEYADWDNFALTLGWERIIISGVTLDENKKYLGMNVRDAAERYGFASSEALAAHLMSSEEGKTAIINMSMCQDDIDVIARLPYSSVISDSIYADTDTPHPRMFGAMPKLLADYVLRRKVLTMEEGIRKMTSLPAMQMGLKTKGCILPGMDADLLLFDKDNFRDNAVYESPAHYATGLDGMWIGGRRVIEDDRVLTREAGCFIRRGM